MSWPALPKLSAKAAYLVLSNARKANALSLGVLRDLKAQMIAHHTSPVDGKLRVLPPFRPDVLSELESASSQSDLRWLVSTEEWQKHRQGLPNVIVLRSEGPTFSAGHDLKELRSLSYDEVKETFALCAEVMSLIRRSPAPVVGRIQGLATAAGCQLALTTDLPIAAASTYFQLPGATLGLPCSSPSTAVARRLGHAFTYRMLATAVPMRANELPGGAVEIVKDEEELDARVQEVATKLAQETAGQPTALGKWAFWTQVGMKGDGDAYEEAAVWAGRVMALHAKGEDAQEGINAFFEKRKPQWRT
jgi:enoyl-CoA hydratase/carnithine racemase